ncbi:MAG: Zn-ribbon domain-containing OB-fold protein [Promethearchaeota archaeon]
MRIPMRWREIPQHYRLEGSKCTKCSKVYFPPRPICQSCRSTILEKIFLPKKGKVVTFTTVRVAPQTFELYVPYIVGIIELDGGTRLTAQITDCDPSEVYIGMPVETIIRKVNTEGDTGPIFYCYKFRPELGSTKSDQSEAAPET